MDKRFINKPSAEGAPEKTDSKVKDLVLRGEALATEMGHSYTTSAHLYLALLQSEDIESDTLITSLPKVRERLVTLITEALDKTFGGKKLTFIDQVSKKKLLDKVDSVNLGEVSDGSRSTQVISPPQTKDLKEMIRDYGYSPDYFKVLLSRSPMVAKALKEIDNSFEIE